MRALAERLGLAESVRFVGFLDRARVADALEESTLLALPSASEPFGIAALEAAARGVPVVLSSRSGAREVLPSARLVEPGDPSALAAEILAQIEERRGRGEALRDESRTLTWTRQAERVLGVYGELIA
jgi:glycosyltransferase involved in cell wall biosynthesis